MGGARHSVRAAIVVRTNGGQRTPVNREQAARPALRRLPKFSLDERQIFLCGRTIFFIAEDGISAGHRSQHQAVPGSEDFVVEMRPDAPAPRVEHFSFRRSEERGIVYCRSGVSEERR